MSQVAIKNCYLERYNVKNGLANSNIEKLYVDSNDILWISTNNSVQIFDGSEFREINNFESKCQLAISESNDIQLINNFSVHSCNEYYTIIDSKVQLATIGMDTCTYVKNDQDNHYIFCNNQQLYLWDTILTPIGERHDYSVILEGPRKRVSLLQMSDSSIWQYQLYSNKIEKNSIPKLGSTTVNRAINSAYIHNKYFITGTRSLYIMNNDKYTTVPYPDQIEAQYHTAICEISDSTAMIAIEQNLFLFNTKNNNWIHQYSDINNNKITSTGYITEIVKDNTGHIYINTETAGLIKLFYASPFDYIGDKNAESNFIKSIIIDDSLNRVIVACLDEGLKVYDKQGTLLSRITKEDIPSNRLRAIGIYPYQNGKYLFYNNADKTMYTLSLGHNNKPITIPFQKLNANLYYEDYTAVDQEKSIILLNKIYQIDHINGTLSEVYDNKGTACSEVFGNQIYIGSRNKISIVNLNTQSDEEIILKNKGLVRGIIVIDENTIVYGCDLGIYRKNLTTEKTDKLYDKCIYGIIQDAQGVIWASGDNGLIRMETNGHYINIYQEQGLQGHEFNTNCVAEDAEGKLYFGGTFGITAFDPNTVNNQTLLPRIYIKEMIVNDSLVAQMHMSKRRESIDLKHHENNIQFKLSAIGQKNPNSYSFQYKMQGVHYEWQKGKLTDDITFNLSPGSYSFDFTADLSSKPNITTIASIPLVILTPWYKSWWFITALLLSAIGSLVFVFSTIQRRKHLKEKYEWDLKSNLQEERIRISRDLHDNIGSQLTYIVSSLDNIRYKIGELDTDLIDKINNINAFGRQTIEELRNTIWVLKKEEINIEELDLKISSYVYRCDTQIEDISMEYKSSIDHTVNVKIKSSGGIHIFRIIQEAIQNAVKHGQCNSIKATSEIENDILMIRIQDNGIGININDQSGYGMKTMKDRAHQIGASLAITSTAGTRIQLSLPVPKTT